MDIKQNVKIATQNSMQYIKSKINDITINKLFNYKVVPANEDKGFNFPYILVVPKQLPYNVKMIVECANSVDYEREDKQDLKSQIDEAENYAKYICVKQDGERFNLPYLYQQLNQPIVIPVIRRCEYERVGELKSDEAYQLFDELDKNTEFYPQQLGRQVVLEKTGEFADVPKQVISMLEDAKQRIKAIAKRRNQEIEISKKSGLAGWSSSAVFASRMQLLCYEYFDLCMAFASGGVQPLPLVEYNGQKLYYPLGVADYKEITGKDFDEEEYAQAKQISVIGSMEHSKYDIAHNQRLFDKQIRELFEATYNNANMWDRQRMIAKILHDNGYDNINCVILENEGHKSYSSINNIKLIEQWLQNNAINQDNVKILLN